jgi:RNA polymerase sigma factor (sigma-70 family)
MRNERRTATDVELPIHVSRADACSPTQGALYALLVEAKRFGESADVALEDLLTDLCEPVRRFAVFRLRYHEDPGDMAEDVVQETLIRVAKAIRTCNAASDAQILAWVRTIARNAMTDMYRSPTTGMAAKLMAQDYHDEMKESANDWQNLAAVPSSPARAYLLALVMAVYDDATEATCELFWLRLIAGLEWGEIAVKFGTTTAGAKRRFQRAQSALQREVVSHVAALPDLLRHDVQSLLRSFSYESVLAGRANARERDDLPRTQRKRAISYSPCADTPVLRQGDSVSVQDAAA